MKQCIVCIDVGAEFKQRSMILAISELYIDAQGVHGYLRLFQMVDC